MSRKKITVLLTDEAHAGLLALTERWGTSQAGTVDMLVRRELRLPPFEAGPAGTLAAIRAGEAAHEEEEPEESPRPMTAEERTAHPELASFVDQMDLALMSPGTGILAVVSSEALAEAPVEQEKAEVLVTPEPVPEAPPEVPHNVAGGRVFTRNWYDDGAPEWVQLLGAEATSGEDLTPEQMRALADWQAGEEPEPPGAKP